MKKRIFGLIGLCMVLLTSGCSGQPYAEPKTKAVILDEEGQAAREYIYSTDYILENTVSYNNVDGQLLVQMFSAPVEYSEIRMNQQDNGSFSGIGRFTNLHLPASLSAESPMQIMTDSQFTHILPAGDGVCTPVQTEQTNVFGQKRQAVVYADFYGPGMDCSCYPTSFGINTELTLKEKPDSNTFRLRLNLPNLIPDTGSPDYILFKTALDNGQVRAILYSPLAVDKKDRWNYENSVRLVEKDSDTGTYLVEYTISEEFLQDKETKYPVTLHQSIHNYKSKQPDTSAYSETGDEAGHYLSPYILLGDSTSKGEGWTYVRYETLNQADIPTDKILSAKYVFRNLFDLDKEVTVGAYPVTADWCSINTRWFNRPPNDDTPVGTTVVKKRGDYEIDVTALLKEMIANKGRETAKYSVQNSFLIRCDTPGGNLLLASGDNGLFSPCLEILLEK